jgi:nicotinamide mononucleotide transporter
MLLSAGMVAGSAQGWLPYSLTETFGFLTGAACVYLVVRENIWNFPFGIANNVFFLVLFSQERLYGDAGLQVVYVALGAHGWYWWLHGGEGHSERKVSHASAAHLGVLAGLVVVGTVGLTAALRAAGGSAPVLDGFTTVLSLAAQYLLNWKFVENWYVWITADVIYIYLYVSRGLHLTAILYFVFLCLCVAGVLRWRRALAAQGSPAAAGAAGGLA